MDNFDNQPVFYLICIMDDTDCNPLQTNLFGKPLKIFTDEEKAKEYGIYMAKHNPNYKIRGFVQYPDIYPRLRPWIDFSEEK